MPSIESLKDLRIERRDDLAPPSRRWPWIVGGVCVLLVVAAAWWWIAAPRAMEVTVATAREVSGATPGAVLNASGYVTARRRATVSSKVTGKVVEVLVEEGMQVQEGQVLARLDPASIRSTVALAEAQLRASRSALGEVEARSREAQINRERAERLGALGVVGQADVDRAQAEADALRARLDLSRHEVTVAERAVGVQRTDLADTVIRAPFSGVAISKDAQPGEMVSPVSAGGGFTRTGITTLVDMSSLEIEVDVNESYINRVRPDQKVVATLDAYPEWQMPARVITTIPTADRQKATVRVRIAFDRLDPRILPDMGVKVAFLPEGEEGAATGAARLVVPRTALRKDGDTDIRASSPRCDPPQLAVRLVRDDVQKTIRTLPHVAERPFRALRGGSNSGRLCGSGWLDDGPHLADLPPRLPAALLLAKPV